MRVLPSELLTRVAPTVENVLSQRSKFGCERENEKRVSATLVDGARARVEQVGRDVRRALPPPSVSLSVSSPPSGISKDVPRSDVTGPVVGERPRDRARRADLVS